MINDLFNITYNYSFGLAPGAPLQVPNLQPSQTYETSLVLGTNGVVQKMEPLNNLQVRNKLYICSFQYN